MKKSLLLLAFLSVAAFAFAQEVAPPDFAPSTVTSGSIVTEHDMAGFQQTSNALSKSYSSDQKIAIAGWTLFAVGIPMTALGGHLIATGKAMIADANYKPLLFLGGLSGVTIEGIGITYTTLGASALISGIVCLGVSYSRMGGHANLTDTGIRERKPLVTYNLQSSSDGLGLAIRF